MLCDKWQSSNIVILAGTRGKGGSRICAARHLANSGADIRVSIPEPDKHFYTKLNCKEQDNYH